MLVRVLIEELEFRRRAHVRQTKFTLKVVDEEQQPPYLGKQTWE
jgi:hypothetical protein